MQMHRRPPNRRQPGPEKQTRMRKLTRRQSRGAIDSFLKSLTEPDIFDVPQPPAGAPPQAQAAVISHLSAVLRADGLAQELDAASPDARSGANGIWYVLSLKALESGGTLLKSGNGITGTKTSYSGGGRGNLRALPFEREYRVLGSLLQL
jgi:hypothetical protein